MTAAATIRALRPLPAALARGIAPLAAVKALTQNMTSTTTFAPDDTLLLQLAANATYYFKCKLGYTGGTSEESDFKLAWSLPSGATMGYASYGALSTTATWNTDTAAEVVFYTNGSGVNLTAVLKGSIVMSSTPGAVQLQWAQHTSSTTPTQVLAGSSLLAWQVA